MSTLLINVGPRSDGARPGPLFVHLAANIICALVGRAVERRERKGRVPFEEVPDDELCRYNRVVGSEYPHPIELEFAPVIVREGSQDSNLYASPGLNAATWREAMICHRPP